MRRLGALVIIGAILGSVVGYSAVRYPFLSFAIEGLIVLGAVVDLITKGRD